ncbi:FG-GAP-like repeat-containing protein [Streptomyces sp. NPDC048696]|uniref:FG-GAP-like repeat-containing protein n=1 Tax=Streptomyces sp. NPDC048696 TaxID=3365585 RepID=UPI0037179528
MRRHTLVRSAVAAVLGFTAGIVPLSGSPASAAEMPGEVVIPAEQQTDPDAADLVGAGETGYLWGVPGQGYNWTSYLDGSTRWLAVPSGMRVEAHGTGTDVVAFANDVQRFVVQRNMKDGSERTIGLHDGQSLEGYFDDVVVTSERLQDRTSRIHLLFWENGDVVDRVVSGLPEGAELLHGHTQSGKSGALAFYEPSGGQPSAVWIDRSGQARPANVRGVSRSTFSGDRYVQWWPSGLVRVWNTADFSAPVSDFKITIPYDEQSDLIGVVGNDLLVARNNPGDARLDTAPNRRIVAVPLGGGPERLVIDKAAARPVFKADGTLLVARAGEAGEESARSVYAVRPGADGAFTVDKVADAPKVRTLIEGMSMAQGQLATVDQVPWRHLRLRRSDISVAGPLKAGPRIDRGSGDHVFSEGCTGELCPALQATGDGRVVYDSYEDRDLHVLADGASLPGGKVSLPPEAFPQLDRSHASGRYEAVAFRGSADDRYAHHIQVIDLDTGRPVYTSPGSKELPSYGMAGSTLWVEDEDNRPGALYAVDVRTGKVVSRPRVADCGITRVQANAGFVYWACDAAGLSVPSASGVYDLAAERSIRLPEHRSAMLGDGYVAWEKDGVLNVTDFRGATGTRAVGRPVLQDKDKGWTVDRFGGPVAYADKDGDVHLVPSGVKTSDLDVIDADTPASANGKSGEWKARWWLSKPASSWQLVLRNASSGATVRTFDGGEARGLLKSAWDGKDSAGQLLPKGAYTWSLTARPADGQGSVLSRSGTVTLTGGLPVARDHVGPSGPDGVGDLLAFTPGGVADFRAGTGRGGMDAKVSASGWTGTGTVTAAVPFGDVNGDGCNDVLVRLSSGELRVHEPACGTALAPSTPYTRIGGGWNMFDALTSPGDMTGDGRPDLVARQASTGDLYLYENDGAGNFKPRVRIGTGWKGYLLAGAGDLDGDGKSDLLARDAAGVLWLYPGTGNGTLATRTKVGGGWQIYNALVGAGDLNHDGKPDLLARDTSGVLWSYAGDGRGNLAGRAKIGGGWQMYKDLF